MDASTGNKLERQPDAAAIAEAAVWLARLRSERRSSRLEAQFRRWLEKRPAHAAAFEAVNETWDLAGGVVPAPRRRGIGRSPRRPALLAAAMLLAAVAGVLLWSLRPEPIRTAVGEQRSLKLEDGTAIVINTDTRLRMRFSDSRRLVLLDHGEASFDVAADSLRPFVVQAGNTRVVAVGTEFDVRWTDGALAVTLSTGKVRVLADPRSGVGPPQTIELLPGQRLARPAPGVPPRVGEVDLATARAWQHGQVILQRTPLAEAISEMNRYSEQKLSIETGEAARLTISGAFRSGDSSKFARAIADLYGFEVLMRQDGLHLRRPR